MSLGIKGEPKLLLQQLNVNLSGEIKLKTKNKNKKKIKNKKQICLEVFV